MKLHHVWIAFFLTASMEGYADVFDDYGVYGDVDDGIPDHTGIEGQKISVDCDFGSIEGKRYFCKGKCEDADKLIETVRDYSVKDRYSLRFTNRPGGRGGVMTVSITQLTKADSGLYGCGLNVFGLDPFQKFRITVTDALTTFRPPPELTSLQSTSTPSYQSSTSATESTTEFDRKSTETTKNEPSGTYVWYVVGLVIAMLLFLVAVVILWRKRASQAKEPLKEVCHDNNTEGVPVYDEIREEDRRRGSAPTENINLARFPKASDTVIYSFASEGTASGPQDKAPQDRLVYSQVDFSKAADASLNSATSGHMDNVLYSEVQGPTASQSLYSTVK